MCVCGVVMLCLFEKGQEMTLCVAQLPKQADLSTVRIHEMLCILAVLRLGISRRTKHACSSGPSPTAGSLLPSVGF